MIARRRRSLGAWLLDQVVRRQARTVRAYPTREDRGGTDDPTPAHDPVSLSWGQVDPTSPYQPRPSAVVGRGHGGGWAVPPWDGRPGMPAARRHHPAPRLDVHLDGDAVFIETEGRTYADVRGALITAAYRTAGERPWSWATPPLITPVMHLEPAPYPWLGSCNITLHGEARS